MRLYNCNATCSARNLVSYDTRLFWVDYPYYLGIKYKKPFVVYALRDNKYVAVDDYHHFVK